MMMAQWLEAMIYISLGNKHGIKVGHIGDLIHYRVENEKTVERISQRPFKTKYGQFELFSYLDTIHNDIHIALVKGKS